LRFFLVELLLLPELADVPLSFFQRINMSVVFGSLTASSPHPPRYWLHQGRNYGPVLLLVMRLDQTSSPHRTYFNHWRPVYYTLTSLDSTAMMHAWTSASSPQYRQHQVPTPQATTNHDHLTSSYDAWPRSFRLSAPCSPQEVNSRLGGLQSVARQNKGLFITMAATTSNPKWTISFHARSEVINVIGSEKFYLLGCEALQFRREAFCPHLEG
jgi:hypothetical protein